MFFWEHTKTTHDNLTLFPLVVLLYSAQCVLEHRRATIWLIALRDAYLFFLFFFFIKHTSGSWEQVDTDRCCNLHWETCLGFISGHCCKWLWQPAHKLCLPPVPDTLMKADNIWTNEMGSSLLWSMHGFGEHLYVWPDLGWDLVSSF